MRLVDWIPGLWVGAIAGALAMTFALSQRDRQGIYIPCDVAEISPDFPAKVKEQCRRRLKQ